MRQVIISNEFFSQVLKESGWAGLPSHVTKIRSLSLHLLPNLKRFSFCSFLCCRHSSITDCGMESNERATGYPTRLLCMKKPKGMRWGTYEKLLDEAEQIESNISSSNYRLKLNIKL